MSFEIEALNKIKTIETLLEKKFGASGKGLHTKVSSVENQLDPYIVRKIRRIASIRNKLFHNAEFVFDDSPDVFLLDCDYVVEYLNLTASKQTSTDQSDRVSSFNQTHFRKRNDDGVEFTEKDNSQTPSSVPNPESANSERNTPPLILRNGQIIRSIDDLMEFAKTQPNAVKGESRAISIWLETLGYSQGESLDIQLKMHFSALGKKPEEITSEMMPDLDSEISKYKVFEGELPPPPDKAKAGDVWIHPVDRSEMVFVPAGKFVMGYPKEKLIIILKRLNVPDERIPNFIDETPARLVYLDPFWIDKYPITNAQFADFIEDAKPTPPPENAWRYPQIVQHARGTGGNYPIHDISFYEAMAYCDWVGKILPTEAQWEKAARGNIDDRPLPWGGTFVLDWINSIETSQPFPDGVEVYQHKSNVSPYGCVQMVGNIEEWCLDAYDPDYYSAENNTYNPTGPQSTKYGVVVRGGSTAKPVAFARVSSRNYCAPNKQAEFTGFRCVYVYGLTRNWSSKL